MSAFVTSPAEVDECKLNRNICGHGECESGLNGYVCRCHHGYRFNPLRNICEGKTLTGRSDSSIKKGASVSTIIMV